jgi:hypothetical protein
MNPREKRWNFFNRNFLIGLLIVLIVLSAVIFIVTSPPQDPIKILSPDNIIDNSDKYLGEIITVEGYYYNEGIGKSGVITSSIIPSGSEFEFYKRLPVDYSDVNISLIDETKYRFTGMLLSDTSIPADPIILKADDIVAV